MTQAVQLPANWTATNLGEIAQNVRPRSKPQESPQLRFIGMENVEAHTMRLVGTVPASQMKSAATHFQPGDVLYGRLRPYLNKVITVDFEGLASAEFIPLTALRGISPEFLKYRLNAVEFVAFTSTLDTGDRPRVDYEQISEFRFGLPPTREQHRIVEAIESYLTRLDDAVASLERVQRNLERYRASVLKAAVEGRLVPTEAELARREGRDYEPASVLLERILAERKTRWIEDAAEKARAKAEAKVLKASKRWTPEDNTKALAKARVTAEAKYKEPAPPDTTDLPDLPEGWCWTTVDSISANRERAICAGPFGTIFKAKDFRPEGVPIIFLRHVKPDEYRKVKPKYMDRSKWDELFEQYSVFGGELLVTKLGDPPGDCAVFPECEGVAMLTPDVMKLEVHEEIARRYVMHYLNSFVARSLAFGVAFGVTRLRLTLPLFRSLVVPIPPRKEQCRIVEAVDRQVSLARTLGAEAVKGSHLIASLHQSILKWAFEGKLVEQDPDDLPAPRPGRSYVYALECSDGSIYIGQTQDILERWTQHARGRGADWTRRHPPGKLVHWEEYDSLEQAVNREKHLKTGFGRQWLKREIKAGRTRQAGEPASVLLERIREEREAAAKANRKRKKT